MSFLFPHTIFNRVNKYLFLYLGILAWAVGLFVHYKGLQRLKNTEAEQKYNLN